MPTLIFEQPGQRAGGPIRSRVLIGRLPTNGIVTHEPTVSRLHAWIDRDRAGVYFVGDSGSLAGTQVNGRAVAKRKSLDDGDVIRIGRMHIIFALDETLPSDVVFVNLDGSPPSNKIADAGVLFDCPCGTPVWFKAAAIGQAHICRHCGRTITIPDKPGVVAEVVPPPVFIEPGGIATPAAPPTPERALYDAPADPVPAPAANPEPARNVNQTPIRTPVAVPMPRLESPPTGNSDSFQAFGFDDAAAGTEASPRSSLFQHGVPPKPQPRPSTAELVESASGVISLDAFVVDQIDELPALDTQCSICHSPIGTIESSTTCPSCKLTFHTDCWRENLGCSAYGCDQVGILKPADAPPDKPVEVSSFEDHSAEDEEAEGFPWEFVFMAMSVAGSLLGALAYGVPTLIGALGTTVYLVSFDVSRKRKSIAIVALTVCLIGSAAGVYLSYQWWNGWPVGRAISRGPRP